jgi:hypothetical protein
MPDITYSLSLKVDKDNLVNQVQISQITASMAQSGYKSVVYDLSTNATSISTANLSAVGMAFLRNLSTASASTAQIGIEAGGSFASFATLRGGEPAIVRLSAGTDYQAIGSSGTRLRVDITEG